MILPDANLLLYAVNADSRDHKVSLRWWRGLLEKGEPVGLCGPVVFAFVRLSTSGRVLTAPLDVDEAFEYVDNWLSFPSVSWLGPDPSHYGTVKNLLLKIGTAGNLVVDAQIAAIALYHNAVVYTADMDFSRFAGLRWKNPLLGKP